MKNKNNQNTFSDELLRVDSPPWLILCGTNMYLRVDGRYELWNDDDDRGSGTRNQELYFLKMQPVESITRGTVETTYSYTCMGHTIENTC